MTDYYSLANGHQIPKLGFGTWELKDGEETYQAVRAALEVGYRHIDTAQTYKNEASVGKAIADADVAREDIFLTTKIWNSMSTYEETLQSINDSLLRLKTDYVDLLLIHWPNPVAFRVDPGFEKRNAEVWRAMETAYKDGRARAIGISNFRPHHLAALLKTAEITPMVNQIKLTPGLTHEHTVQDSRAHGLLMEAYSPLGSGAVFDSAVITALAEKYGKTNAQIALRWAIDHDFLPLTRSRTRDHIAANADIFDFSLSAADIATLDTLEGMATDLNPDETDF